MSLNAFKEALKPCKNNSSSSSYPSGFSSRISQDFDSSITSRKPPKSSLSRQLLRLEEDTAIQQEEKEEKNGLKDSKLEPSRHLDHTGPYEPLVLSLPGEIPVAQLTSYRWIAKIISGIILVKVTAAVIECCNIHFFTSPLPMDISYLIPSVFSFVDSITCIRGLGKTIQAIAFLAAVFGKSSEPDLISHKGKQIEKGPVLIICPSSVILNWESEFSKWSTFSVSVYHGANRDLIIDKLKAHGVEILITSFDTYRIQGNILSDIQWEIVIIDEAHRLKNEKSKLYTACLKIRTLKRYGLTGTIMQNKIMELFNLFDLVIPGRLGTREHFREFYDEPLKHGQRSSAPQRFVQVADERKQHLVSVLQKYMLRRTKEETIGHLMMGKEDNVVFCAMSEMQKRVYQRTLQLPDIQCLVNKDHPCSCGSPLKQVECCKRTVPNGIIWPYLHRGNPEGCDSCPFCLVLPCLVKLQQLSNHLELIKPNSKDDQEKQKRDAEFASAVLGSDIDIVGGIAQSESFMGMSDVRHCGKMRALEKLLHSWISMGDKILLFSYSVRMLDILEKFIIRKGYSFARLDGSTPTSARSVISFWSKEARNCFPSSSGGSLEELIYTRQVYKQQLSNIAVAGKMERRYFEGVQGELFGICNLFRDLSNELFTSEIVQVHEKETSAKGFVESESNEPKDKRKARVNPMLEDLGAVYTHRNEDIVNFGGSGSGMLVEDGKLSMRLKEDVKQPCPLPPLLMKKQQKSQMQLE
ncbi:hypothetical protein DH2020_022989 [Rehmannia glutinosa]|uniref:Helicase ATP-binding domain-containing protein n=1 Tax=Rehmannia glutinosa TaxID=99300 RepID=A0ABR0W4R4_REHGL